jgi:A/G-specific adenine glycosylase
LLERWPTPNALAQAVPGEVSALLRPLGLQQKRAILLVTCARAIVRNHRGAVPRKPDDLQELPYVGQYASDAVLCFGFGRRRAVLDANVARIYRRVFGLSLLPLDLRHADELRRLAETVLPRRRVREFNWGLLDLGGLICKSRLPVCSQCPMLRICQAHLVHACGCDPRPRHAPAREITA